VNSSTLQLSLTPPIYRFDKSAQATTSLTPGAALSKGIALCEQHQDYQTRDILLVQLKDTEEDHAYWLETQLGLIERVGLENYLQSQM
jgi:bacterioferritin (cytochrome b1)